MEIQSDTIIVYQVCDVRFAPNNAFYSKSLCDLATQYLVDSYVKLPDRLTPSEMTYIWPRVFNLDVIYFRHITAFFHLENSKRLAALTENTTMWSI